MSVSIQNLSKDSILSENTAFLAPSCVDGEVIYFLTTQSHTFKIIPDFKTLKVIDLDSHIEKSVSTEEFCETYIEPLDCIVICSSQDNEEKSVAQLINDIQIYKALKCLNGDDICI